MGIFGHAKNAPLFDFFFKLLSLDNLQTIYFCTQNVNKYIRNVSLGTTMCIKKRQNWVTPAVNKWSSKSDNIWWIFKKGLCLLWNSWQSSSEREKLRPKQKLSKANLAFWCPQASQLFFLHLFLNGSNQINMEYFPVKSNVLVARGGLSNPRHWLCPKNGHFYGSPIHSAHLQLAPLLSNFSWNSLHLGLVKHNWRFLPSLTSALTHLNPPLYFIFCSRYANGQKGKQDYCATFYILSSSLQCTIRDMSNLREIRRLRKGCSLPFFVA